MDHMEILGQVEAIALAVAVFLFGLNTLVKIFATDVLETIRVTKEKCFASGVCKSTSIEITEEKRG